MNNKTVVKIKRKKEANKLKATGIVRRIDDLGRVVIPKEIRRTLKLEKVILRNIY